jgi:transposase
MWPPRSQLRVWLHRRPADLRKSFDGLAALVKHELGEQPASGALYVFANRRRTILKVLYYERGGYCLWSKRLEQGQFQVRFDGAHKAAIDLTVLELIIEGIDTRAMRRFKRYKRPAEDRHGIDVSVQ